MKDQITTENGFTKREIIAVNAMLKFIELDTTPIIASMKAIEATNDLLTRLKDSENDK